MAKSTIDRLTSLGEQVRRRLSKAQQNPTANRVLQGAMQMKDRVDDLSKRVRGLEAMEKRMAELEKRLAKLEGAAKRAARVGRSAQQPPRRKTATKK